MRVATSSALCDLPTGECWDFGGVAYGLEPLVLPTAGAFDAGAFDAGEDGGADATGGIDATDATDFDGLVEHLYALRANNGLTSVVEPCPEQDELFWFRWITGHQVCFIVWRLIGQLIEDVDRGRCAPAEIMEAVARYVDAYSAMLLYTGSCPRDLYSVLIRPSMRLQHRAFSGGWAPDYWPIRTLFRRRQLTSVPGGSGELHDELDDALTLLHLVHDGVAARLVTNGKSLLREAATRGPSHRQAWMMYDSYFVTLRAPVPAHEVVAQLLRRIVAITQDLAANGLYDPADTDERPVELQAAEVLKCENSLTDILLDLARCASEPVGGPVSPLRPTAANSPGRGVSQ